MGKLVRYLVIMSMEEVIRRHYNEVNKREGKLNKPRKDLDYEDLFRQCIKRQQS